MTPFHEQPPQDDSFTGHVRLLTLSDLVMFPRVMQPLHIFEPRFCELIEDALSTDRLVGIATLAHEPIDPSALKFEEIEPHACLCRIVAHHRKEDDTLNILVAGLSRIQLIRPIKSDKSYQVMQARLCHDDMNDGTEAQIQQYRQQLHQALMQSMEDMPEANQYLEQLLGFDLPLGILTDIAGFILDLEKDVKLKLLAETDIMIRSEMLLSTLRHPGGAPWLIPMEMGSFPPAFSVN